MADLKQELKDYVATFVEVQKKHSKHLEDPKKSIFWVSTDTDSFHDFCRDIDKRKKIFQIRTDYDFWVWARLPMKYIELPLKDVIEVLWPSITDPILYPDHGDALGWKEFSKKEEEKQVARQETKDLAVIKTIQDTDFPTLDLEYKTWSDILAVLREEHLTEEGLNLVNTALSFLINKNALVFLDYTHKFKNALKLVVGNWWSMNHFGVTFTHTVTVPGAPISNSMDTLPAGGYAQHPGSPLSFYSMFRVSQKDVKEKDICLGIIEAFAMANLCAVTKIKAVKDNRMYTINTGHGQILALPTYKLAQIPRGQMLDDQGNLVERPKASWETKEN